MAIRALSVTQSHSVVARQMQLVSSKSFTWVHTRPAE